MAGYRVTNLPEGTMITYWPDPRGPGHGKCEVGYVEAMAAQTCRIVWAGYRKNGQIVESKITNTVEVIMADQLKYLQDRGQLRIFRPPKQRRVRLPPNLVTCKSCGVTRDIGCNCPRPGALKPEHWGQKKVKNQLTSEKQDDRIYFVNDNDEGNPVTKGHTMATKTKKGKKKAKVEEVELDDDFVELDEVEEEEEEKPDPTEGFLSAKEAATKIGTDARTLRKFLRKKSGKIGQGKRWLIDPDDLDELKTEFEASLRGSSSSDDEKPKKSKKSKDAKKKKAKVQPDPDEDDDEDDDEEEFEVLDQIDDL